MVTLRRLRKTSIRPDDEKLEGEDEVAFYYGYDEDNKDLFILNAEDGTTDTLSKGDLVKVVYITVDDANYALAAFIMQD